MFLYINGSIRNVCLTNQLGQKANVVDLDPDPDQLRSALIFGWLDLDRDPDQTGKKDPQKSKEILCFEALDGLF
jgi:hypothetical protein